MRKNNRLLSVIAAAALLAGCGSNSGDYGTYVTLGDYKNLSATLSVAEVTEEEQKNYEQEQLEEYVTYNEVQTSAKEGQMVSVSLLAEDGDEVVYDFSEEGYDIIVGEEEFGDEVDAALIGSRTGDVLDFVVSYEDDFEDSALCGRDISYHMEVRAVSDIIYPELTNEFVKEQFGKSSVEAWRETLAQELQSQHQAEATEALRSDLVQQVIDGAKISGYPKALFQQKRAEVESEYQSYADMFGCTLEEIYEMFGVDDKTREQQVLDVTNRTMVLALIREKEQLSLSDEQMQEKFEEYAQENEYESVEELLTEYDEESLKQYFLDELTIDFLEEHAHIS